MILRKSSSRFIFSLLFFLICLPLPVRAIDNMRRAAIVRAAIVKRAAIGFSALVAAGGIIVWWLYSRFWANHDKNELNKPSDLDEPVTIGNSFYEGREISLENGAFVTQVRVPAQESADCGIYAGVNCVGLLAKEAGDESWGSQLCNKEYLKKFLAEGGERRIAIVCNELRLAYYNYIRNCLINCLRPDEASEIGHMKNEGYNTDQIKEKYKSLLNSFCIKLVNEILSGQRGEISCRNFSTKYLQNVNIDIEDVSKYVRTGVSSTLPIIQTHIRNAFYSYFDETKLIRHEMSLEDLQKKVKKFDFPSGWLDGEQIEPIIRFFLGQEWPAHEDYNLYTIVPSGDDLVYLNNADYSELDCFFPHRHFCRQVLEQLKNPGVREFFHCFVLGAGHRENQAIEKPIDGHWFAVLVHKLKEQRKYIVADSLNWNCLNNDPFNPLNQLITVLEDNRTHLENGLRFILKNKREYNDNGKNILRFIHERYQECGGNYEGLGGEDQFLAQFNPLLEKKT